MYIAKVLKQINDNVYSFLFKLSALIIIIAAFSINCSAQTYSSVRNINEFVNLSAALSVIGSTPTILVVNAPITLTENTIIPANIRLEINPGGMIRKASTYTLTINGPFSAGFYQIFNGFAAGDVTGFSLSEEIYPEWWGARANDATDCTYALQSAADALTRGGKIKISNGIYRFVNFNILRAGISLEGNGWDSILSTNLAPVGMTVPAVWVRANNVEIKNLKVTWVTLPTALVALNPINQNNTISVGYSEIAGMATLIEGFTLDNVYILGGKTHGIGIGRAHNITVKNSRVEGVYGTGIWGYYVCNVSIKNNYIFNTNDAGIDMTANGPDEYGPDDFSENVIIEENKLKDTLVGIGLHGVSNGTANANIIDGTWGDGIFAGPDGPGGHVTPHGITITNNTLTNIFQFYGPGKYVDEDAYSKVGGRRFAIEAYVVDTVTISDNSILDNSGLSMGQYGAILAGAQRVSVTGNTSYQDWPLGIYFTNGEVPTNYSDILSLTVSDNKVAISSGHGAVMLALFGTARGTIFDNYFDCGGQTLASPMGRFLLSWWSKDVSVTGNVILNTTEEYVDNSNSSGISFLNNSHQLSYANYALTESNTRIKVLFHRLLNHSTVSTADFSVANNTVRSLSVYDIDPYFSAVQLNLQNPISERDTPNITIADQSFASTNGDLISGVIITPRHGIAPNAPNGIQVR